MPQRQPTMSPALFSLQFPVLGSLLSRNARHSQDASFRPSPYPMVGENCPPLDSRSFPAYPRSVPLFSRQNAADMQRRSVQARKARHLAPPEPPQPPPTPDPFADDFTSQRLTRVRKQLERIDSMIETETDPQKLDRLAAASMRLSDQEFALANRPKPGNRRPGPERVRRGAGLELLPLPSPVVQPAPVQVQPAPAPIEQQPLPAIQQPGAQPARPAVEPNPIQEA